MLSWAGPKTREPFTFPQAQTPERSFLGKYAPPQGRMKASKFERGGRDMDDAEWGAPEGRSLSRSLPGRGTGCAGVGTRTPVSGGARSTGRDGVEKAIARLWFPLGCKAGCCYQLRECGSAARLPACFLSCVLEADIKQALPLLCVLV